MEIRYFFRRWHKSVILEQVSWTLIHKAYWKPPTKTNKKESKHPPKTKTNKKYKNTNNTQNMFIDFISNNMEIYLALSLLLVRLKWNFDLAEANRFWNEIFTTTNNPKMSPCAKNRIDFTQSEPLVIAFPRSQQMQMVVLKYTKLPQSRELFELVHQIHFWKFGFEAHFNRQP